VNAYGIWQNKNNANHPYTIVGGLRTDTGGLPNQGFVVDYDWPKPKGDASPFELLDGITHINPTDITKGVQSYLSTITGVSCPLESVR